jgi:hypothetical protein
LLDTPVDAALRRPLLTPPPLAVVVAGGGALVLALGAHRLGLIGLGPVRVVGIAACHGALLAWALATVDPRWRRPAAALGGELALAAALAQWSPWGAGAYAAVPLTLLGLATRRPELARLGLVVRVPPPALALGLAAGLFLGGHLLLSANRTFGYQAHVTPLGAYLAALAYDVGANVPSAESFFRGVLFDRAQRRLPFWSAVLVATTAVVVRYLLDPALPATLEVAAGAVFYVTLLSVTSCALYRWSGSLVPGALAGLAFFAAYRAIGSW